MRHPKRSVISGLLLLMIFVISVTGYSVYRDDHRHFTYVLVHGAYGGGWGFRELDAELTADHQKVFRPTLTGQGERVHLLSADVNLNTHIQDVVNLILFEDLHDVVLVGHSYGGMVVTGVADRIPDRIKAVIYLDAILPEDGESEQTAAGGALYHPNEIKVDINGSQIPPWLKPNTPLPHDVPEPAGAFITPISLRDQKAARAIPTTYVLYVPPGKKPKDAKFFPFYLRAIARHWQTRTLISDHNAQWSHPRELTNLLEGVPLE